MSTGDRETERSGARPDGRETERSGARPDGRETERSGAGGAVPDSEHYLDLSGIEDEESGPHFDVVLRGYDRTQVDEHVAGLRRMVAQLRAQLAVRERRRSPTETAATDTSAMNAGTVPQARVPAEPPAGAHDRGEGDDDLGAFNDRLRGILQAAEQEAQLVRSRAAETLLAEHAESRAALAELRTQRDAVVDELVRLRSWLDEIVAHPGRTPAGPPPVLPPGPPRGGPWPGPPAGPPPPPRPPGRPGPPQHHPGPAVGPVAHHGQDIPDPAPVGDVDGPGAPPEAAADVDADGAGAVNGEVPPARS